MSDFCHCVCSSVKTNGQCISCDLFVKGSPYCNSVGAPVEPDIPESIRVVGMTLALLVRGYHTDNYLDNKYGYCDHQRMQIVLSDQNSPDQMRETTVHEIIHALEAATHVTLEEDEVGRLGRALYSVIRDNPALFAWLQS